MVAIDIIERIPVFTGLDRPTLVDLQDVIRRIHVPAEEFIFRQGEEAENLYYLESGEVGISVQMPECDRATVAIVSPGDCFGWSALVPPHRFTATATPLAESRILVIGGEELRIRMRRHSVLAWRVFENVSRTISERLAHARSRLAMSEWMHRHPMEPAPTRMR